MSASDASPLDALGPQEGRPARVFPAPLPCGEPPARDAVPLTDAALACMALDGLPDAGVRAPAWLLGPWADALARSEPSARRAWRAAVAASAPVIAVSPARTLIDTVHRRGLTINPGC